MRRLEEALELIVEIDGRGMSASADLQARLLTLATIQFSLD